MTNDANAFLPEESFIRRQSVFAAPRQRTRHWNREIQCRARTRRIRTEGRRLLLQLPLQLLLPLLLLLLLLLQLLQLLLLLLLQLLLLLLPLLLLN